MDMLSIGRRVLENQPFASLVGVELVRLEPGQAEVRIPIKPDLRQHAGYAHGGVVAVAIDTAVAFAAATGLRPDEGRDVVTSNLTIDYLRPALKGSLVAQGTVVRTGQSRIVVRCEVYVHDNDSKRLCATAQGTAAMV